MAVTEGEIQANSSVVICISPTRAKLNERDAPEYFQLVAYSCCHFRISLCLVGPYIALEYACICFLLEFFVFHVFFSVVNVPRAFMILDLPYFATLALRCVICVTSSMSFSPDFDWICCLDVVSQYFIFSLLI